MSTVALKSPKELSISEAEISEAKDWSSQYPYFAPSHIIRDYGSSGTVQPRTKYLFNLNPTLLASFILNQKYGKEENLKKKTQEKQQETTENLNVPGPSLNEILEPTSMNDYYQSQGVNVGAEIPDRNILSSLHQDRSKEKLEEEQSLLVQMSFRDWLITITETKRKEKEDFEEQEALKLKWKQQKLAEAIQEENDEIPEQVFKMAVDSIEKEESLASESLAEVYRRQGKIEKAISIYRKLILINPKKKIYFANKIEELNKLI